MQKPVVKSLITGNEITYSFKMLTYRQFQDALVKFQESKEAEKIPDRTRLSEEAMGMLVDGMETLIGEAHNSDVQRVLNAAIDFNQLEEEDLKKSA